MFTSGTTNKPKAVVHTHANAIWAGRLGSGNIDLGPEDRYLIYLPFFHVNADVYKRQPRWWGPAGDGRQLPADLGALGAQVVALDRGAPERAVPAP